MVLAGLDDRNREIRYGPERERRKSLPSYIARPSYYRPNQESLELTKETTMSLSGKMYVRDEEGVRASERSQQFIWGGTREPSQESATEQKLWVL